MSRSTSRSVATPPAWPLHLQGARLDLRVPPRLGQPRLGVAQGEIGLGHLGGQADDGALIVGLVGLHRRPRPLDRPAIAAEDVEFPGRVEADGVDIEDIALGRALPAPGRGRGAEKAGQALGVQFGGVDAGGRQAVGPIEPQHRPGLAHARLVLGGVGAAGQGRSFQRVQFGVAEHRPPARRRRLRLGLARAPERSPRGLAQHELRRTGVVGADGAARQGGGQGRGRDRAEPPHGAQCSAAGGAPPMAGGARRRRISGERARIPKPRTKKESE